MSAPRRPDGRTAASEPLTMSVVEAGRLLGLGKEAAYAAAHSGVLPIIRVGRRFLVPRAAFEAMLKVRSRQEIIAAELVRRLHNEEVAPAPQRGRFRRSKRAPRRTPAGSPRPTA